MKEELTREVLEAMKRCEYPRCGMCSLYGEKCCKSIKTIITNLSSALLEEMDKPKVWDGAPEDALQAQITWFTKNGGYIGMKTYTREIPKTRARQIAEEVISENVGGVEGKVSLLTDLIETALEKYAAELKGKE